MNRRLPQIQDWLERARGAKWCATTMAKNCGVSLRTLERHFLKEMKKCPKAWLAEQRQQRALELIQSGCSVKDAALSLDYKHSTHLSRDYNVYLRCCSTDKAAPNRV